MSTVAFGTYCHPPKYAEMLHRPGALRTIVESHQFPFSDVVVVHQKCRAQDYLPFDYPCRTIDLPRQDFDPLLRRFGIDPDNQRAEEISHGEGAAHWWKAHVCNLIKVVEATDSEYIVLADCDTAIVRQPSSWIEYGLGVLQSHPEVLIVGPGDGAENGGPGEGGRILDNVRLTRNVSQQLFLCRGADFRQWVNFDVPWDGDYWAPGGPLQEWYVMLEGRLGNFMRHSGTWRAVLPDKYRYWHWSQWDPPGCYEKVEW